MNKTDNIFGGGLPRSKERQQVIQLLQQNNKQPPKEIEVKQLHAAKEGAGKKEAKKRDKSSVIELKELKRLCLEELKKEIIEGKTEGLPTNSSAVYASNKR